MRTQPAGKSVLDADDSGEVAHLYKLFYYPLNASMAPHFVLEELGVDYELHLVDRQSNAHNSTDYLALNPFGRIPTLIDNDLIILESAAICLHLGDKHPEANLVPVAGNPGRAKVYQWLMYLTNTVQAELMIHFYPERHTLVPDQVAAIVGAQELRITGMFRKLNEELENKNYLVGDAISVCDFYLFMLAVWADEFERPPLSFDNLSRYLGNLARRDAIITVCRKEKLSLDIYR